MNATSPDPDEVAAVLAVLCLLTPAAPAAAPPARRRRIVTSHRPAVLSRGPGVWRHSAWT
ncbi:acyl-CoA carboxylase epsilon subunit [Micromonospora sp. NPDC049101]|uniref:acyl-CoA carboxylase epsilon subunit n=1 Tax=unclassified Micromonospora TaxID=2617518 RepID=UPI0030E25F87